MEIRRKKLIKIAGSFIAVVLVVVVVAAMSIKPYRDYARRSWKDRAISNITRVFEDQNWISKEVKRLKRQKKWQSEYMLLMESGEWLVYMNEDAKRDWRIDDIFIAKGSDKKWYYSTFHFCMNMVGLHMCQEVQPSGLSYFINEYRLEEFDGISDDCLKATKMYPASWDRAQAESNGQQ